MPIQILFLSAQLQPFLVSGIRSLLRDYDVELMVYAQRDEFNQLLDIPSSNRLRVFLYDYDPDVFFWSRAKEFNPHIVWTAGWMYSLFLNWVKAFRQSGSHTICAMDTQWKGTLKQQVLTWLAPFLIKRYFTHVWVPGMRQEQYARRLGFTTNNILHHLYAPNTILFSETFPLLGHSNHFPRKFLYVGRLEPHKLKNLLLAFHQLNIDESDPWRLQVIGNGSMQHHELLNHKYIDYLPSMTQKQLLNCVAKGAVFCLCSTEEPWGTVVQEFAAAGMPLLLSKQCGSSEHFVQDNGLICDGARVESIRQGMEQLMQLPDEKLLLMSTKSHQLGTLSNSDTWAKELMSIV